ncbi:MAG: hypothetical protein WD627_00085 [Actinomycetota bacterium]
MAATSAFRRNLVFYELVVVAGPVVVVVWGGGPSSTGLSSRQPVDRLRHATKAINTRHRILITPPYPVSLEAVSPPS